MERQTGITTKQILTARKKAVYIWVTCDFQYIGALARTLKRTDLTFASPRWLENQNWRGRYVPEIVIDHAVQLNQAQRESLRLFQEHMRREISEYNEGLGFPDIRHM